MAYFLGMDIGGTKTAVALYDREFRPVGKQTMPTRPESGCRELVGRIAEAVQALLDGQHAGVSDVLAAGVACPGPLDLKQGRIVYIPTMGFADEPLTAMLEEALGLPVALENDTNAAALCESVFGQGRGGELVDVVEVGPPEPSEEEKRFRYEARTVELLRELYSSDDEAKVVREYLAQLEGAAAAFQDYNRYVVHCKQQAALEVYGQTIAADQ